MSTTARADASKQYIGITGFMSREEVNAVLGATIKPLARVSIMVGVLASAKTLRGEVGTKAPRRYPLVGDIGKIFTPDPSALNLIHFAPGGGPGLAAQLAKLTELGGPYLDGFQLNAIWPDVEELQKHAGRDRNQRDRNQRDRNQRDRSQRIVLQLGPTVLSTVKDADDLAVRVRNYTGAITDVLIDPSGGVGRAFDVAKAERYIEALRELGGVGIGVAGGLGPGALDSIRSLMRKFPELSIDAEGRLRDENDDLSTARAIAYAREAYEILDGAQMELL